MFFKRHLTAGGWEVKTCKATVIFHIGQKWRWGGGGGGLRCPVQIANDVFCEQPRTCVGKKSSGNNYLFEPKRLDLRLNIIEVQSNFDIFAAVLLLRGV